MKQIVGIEIILYVHDQKRSTEFYTALFRRKPHINVPGMTEFILSDHCKLGLMPNDGIVKILKDFMPHPDRGNGIPRCELYLRTNGVTAEYDNALQIEAKLISVVKSQNWGDDVCSPWREFCEELIATEILNWRPFRYIDYRFKKKSQSPIIDLDMGGKGLFIYEVFDLVINDDQMPLLKDLKNKTSENYIWVTDEVIQTLGDERGSKSFPHEIGPHTKYAQNLKWSK